jgi:septal ring factor EnvC (AmiA/AmiB activator)
MLKILGVCFCTLIISATLFAQQPGNSDELRRKQAEIQREIDDLKNTLKASHQNTHAGLMQLERVKKKLRLREQAIGNINQQINIIEGNIGKSKNEIDRLKTELDTLKQQYARSIVYAYENRSNYDFLNFIFSATSFNDALRRIQYLRAYRLYREKQAAAIVNTQQLLQQKIGSYEVSRKEKDAVLEKQQKQKQDLEIERKEKKQVVADLKTHEKEIAKELTAKQKADQKLRRSIEKAIDREIYKAQKDAAKQEAVVVTKPAATSSAATNAAANKKEIKKSVLEATPEASRISGSFEMNKGRLGWPIDKGEIKIHFGPYKIEGVDGIKGNNPGLTFETEPGAAVKSIFEGEVSSVFYIEGNPGVMIHHGKYFTVYSNLTSVTVAKGDKVTAGQIIGKAANSADGNGEIEFVLMRERDNIDPEKWLRRR